MNNLKEKVTQGLKSCLQITDCSHCESCPYSNAGNSCRMKLKEDSLKLIELQRTNQTAHWIHCDGKSNIWYCSNCGEKINYNNARRTYKKDMKPVEEVNRFCRGCGTTMVNAEK